MIDVLPTLKKYMVDEADEEVSGKLSSFRNAIYA